MANNLTPGGHKPTGYQIKKDLIPGDAPIKLCNNKYTKAVLAEDYVDLADLLISQNDHDYYIAVDRYKTEQNNNYFAVNYCKVGSDNIEQKGPWEHNIDLPFKNAATGSAALTKFVMAGSRPTFKKLVAFCGKNEKIGTKDIEIFEYNKANSIQISRSDYGFSFSFTNLSGNSQTTNTYNNGQSVIPTCLFVQLQAEGGKGGAADASAGGCGGGAGDCQFILLDWAAALKYVKENESSSFNNINGISFYIKNEKQTENTGYNIKVYISYKLPTWTTPCSLLLLTIHGGSNGQTKEAFGGARGAMYERTELAKNNTFILIQEPRITEQPQDYGYGGIPSYSDYTGTKYDGYNSCSGTVSNVLNGTTTALIGHYISLNKHLGGKCGEPYGLNANGGGGGGASIVANGGAGGSFIGSKAGEAGRCGSGGGGAGGTAYGAPGIAGNGGCAYIVFYTDHNFGNTVPVSSDIDLTITRNSSYEVSSTTYIGKLQEESNPNNFVYIYPNTTTLSYPTGCNESNTLFYYNQSGYWLSIKMSKVDINTAYTSCTDSRANPYWSYDIKFTAK